MYGSELIKLAAGGHEPDFEYDTQVFDRAAEWIYDRGGFTPEMLSQKPAQAVMDETYRILDSAISSSIGFETPEVLTAALRNNAFIFSGFKTYHSLREVGLSLTDDQGQLKLYDEFKKDVERIDRQYNQNYLYAEYNHAVASSQMAAKWQDFEEEGDRYDLQYRTAGDEKVRDAHARLHNTTLPVNDPFWNEFLPPNGWNCRCTVVQVRKNKYPESDSKMAVEIGYEMTSKPKEKIFRFNAGKELKLFPDKHPYLPKGCGDCKRRLLLAKGKNKVICTACEIIMQQVSAKKLAQRKAEYESYNNSWKKEYFNQDNGGFTVVHRGRVPGKKTSKNDVAKFEKELSMCNVFARGGFKVELSDEKPGISTPDITLDGAPAELKRTASHTNVVDYAKDAIEKKKAKFVVFQFDAENPRIHREIKIIQAKGWRGYYFFTGREDKIYRF